MADKKPLKLHSTALCPQQFEAGDTVPVDNGGTGLNEAALTGLAGEYLKVNATEDGYETGTPGGGSSYSVYTARVSQSGTDAPVATILENTLGETPTWTYEATGIYHINVTSSLFNTSKIAVFIGANDPSEDDFSDNVVINSKILSDTVIRFIALYALGDPRDGVFNLALEIRVYP